jgi:hypothetical protein
MARMRKRQASIGPALLSLAVAFMIASAPSDAANGTEAARHCSGIYWRTLRNGPQICPGFHGLLADVSLRRLKWSSWGGGEANGSGYYAHTVFPNSHLAYYLSPVTIRLSRPKLCRDGVRIYSYFEYTDYAPRSHRRVSRAAWPIPCNGETGGGNG